MRPLRLGFLLLLPALVTALAGCGKRETAVEAGLLNEPKNNAPMF
jgi:hypothetical protein